MKKIVLGNTGIEVTELCCGALPIGPTQKNLPVEQSMPVIAEALRRGITFIDTAQLYGTYEPIKLAMRETGIRPVISTKSAAVSYEEMDFAVKEALAALDVDYIDIFLLHAARVNTDVFEQRRGAYQCLLDYKARGVIRAAGISTHAVDVVHTAADNPDVDIVFPLINKIGMGIIRGTVEDMQAAIEKCFERGKGVFLMKALAGGNLINDYVSAMEFCRGVSKGRAPIALGVVTKEEVEMAVKYFMGEDISGLMFLTDSPVKEFMVLSSICTKCKACVEACHSGAITVTDGEAAVIDSSRCLKCGYCVAACKSFVIRMI